ISEHACNPLTLTAERPCRTAVDFAGQPHRLPSLGLRQISAFKLDCEGFLKSSGDSLSHSLPAAFRPIQRSLKCRSMSANQLLCRFASHFIRITQHIANAPDATVQVQRTMLQHAGLPPKLGAADQLAPRAGGVVMRGHLETYWPGLRASGTGIRLRRDAHPVQTRQQRLTETAIAGNNTSRRQWMAGGQDHAVSQFIAMQNRPPTRGPPHNIPPARGEALQINISRPLAVAQRQTEGFPGVQSQHRLTAAAGQQRLINRHIVYAGGGAIVDQPPLTHISSKTILTMCKIDRG